jgi:hypothetical protein
MKRILVTGAGGSPAVNYVRSLKVAPEEIYTIGTDCNKYYLKRAETDETHLVPPASEPGYIEIINNIAEESGADFLHVQNDVEMAFVSKNREKINVKTFLPCKATVDICLDKLESYKIWNASGIKQPETMLISEEQDLEDALNKYGKIWLRDTHGAGGRGSMPTSDYKIAKTWMDFKGGWGTYTAAECLQPQSITWMSLWDDGELIVAQSRKRLYWELDKISPSGITGATGTGITISDPTLDDIAQHAVIAVDKNPNGIFSVDLTYDHDGVPNPTEINIGRFFTTHEFFTRCGLNMPYIMLKLAYREALPKILKKINPLEENLAWIRGIDFLPVLTTVDEIEQSVKDLEVRKKNVLGSNSQK